MKNLYKILGVKENASAEEIRNRWIELTKHHHPDLGEADGVDERIKEINEAYQVLKHSSTRVEYDLRRTFGEKKRTGERESYFKKLAVPAGILVIFIIVSALYFKDTTTQRPNDAIPQRFSDPIDSTHRFTDPRTKLSDHPITQLPNTPITPSPNVPNSFELLRNPKTPDDSPSIAIIPGAPKVEPPVQPEKPITQLPNDPKDTQTPRLNDPVTQQGNDPTDVRIEVAQIKPPSLLATEDEVRKFFTNYTDRYNSADVEGFLSLFSSRAVQNQKEGMEGIRKIYTDFFNQGQETRYRTEEMKVEIYQNAIEVKARYEIDQLLKNKRERKAWRGRISWVLGREDGALKIISIDYRHGPSP